MKIETSLRRCGALKNKIEDQSSGKHDNKCADGQRQGFAVPLWLNVPHGIQLDENGVERDKIDGNGENHGHNGTNGDQLSAKQHHHRQKGQKNQLAVGYPVHQILNKQPIRFPSLGRIPLFEGVHAVAVFEIGLEVQNDNVGQLHGQENQNGKFQNDQHGFFTFFLGFGKGNDGFDVGRGNSIDVRLPPLVLGNKSTNLFRPG